MTGVVADFDAVRKVDPPLLLHACADHLPGLSSRTRFRCVEVGQFFALVIDGFDVVVQARNAKSLSVRLVPGRMPPEGPSILRFPSSHVRSELVQ